MGARDSSAEGADNSIHHIILGGRDKRRAGGLVIAFVAILLAILIIPFEAVSAEDPASPDTFLIHSARVCRHVYEHDDFIVTFHYEIHYEADQPTIAVGKMFSFRLMDEEGDDMLGSVVPYPYYNLGYDEGASAFYFSPDDAPEWQGEYIVKIEGNPQYFSSPPSTTYTLSFADYSFILADQEENQHVLGNYIIAIAGELEINWQTEMIIDTTSGTILSSTGESYFLGTISGLNLMAPQIFGTEVLQPDFTQEEWGTGQAQAWATRYEGTWLGDALDGLEDAFGVQWNIITGIGTLIIITGIFIICQWKFQTTSPAPVPASLVLLAATLMGFVAPVMMALATLMVVMFSGYILVFRSG